MDERMYRAQILLKPEQHRALADIARREKQSISEIARRMIQIGLEVSQNEDAIFAGRQQALEELRAIREKHPQVYTGDLINEARQERDEEMDRLWKSES
jgi:hypothetical protein